MYEELSSTQIVELLIRFGIEALILVALLLLAWFRLGLKQTLQGVGRWQSKVVVGFFVILTITQLIDRWQYHFPSRISFYPMARFAMYQTGEARPTVRSYQFTGKFADEESGFCNINITKEFPAIGLPPTSTRFRVISRELVSGDRAKVEWAERQIRAFCRGICELKRNRGEPVPRSIRFVVESWDPQTLQCHPLKVLEFETDASQP